MSDDRDITGPDDDSVVAAEYVLRLLPPEEHAAMAARLRDTPALRAETRFWRARLSGLDAHFGEAPAPTRYVFWQFRIHDAPLPPGAVG